MKMVFLTISFIAWAASATAQRDRFSAFWDSPTVDRCSFRTRFLVDQVMVIDVRVPPGIWSAAIMIPPDSATNSPTIIDLGTPFCSQSSPSTAGWCFFFTDLRLSDEQARQLFDELFTIQIESEGGRLTGRIRLDNDADGVPDQEDQCLQTPFNTVVNSSGCSLSQLCPCESDWRNHGKYVKCVVDATVDFLREGSASRVREWLGPRESDCGKQRTHWLGGQPGLGRIVAVAQFNSHCFGGRPPLCVAPIPYSGKLLVFTPNGWLVAAADWEFDFNGPPDRTYTFELKPGKYVIAPDDPCLRRYAQNVTVRKNQVVNVGIGMPWDEVWY